MTNKILMVGVLDVASSTNVFMAKGFEQLGYEVHPYNYRTVIKERGGLFAMWNDLRDFLIGKKYDLTVFCKTNQVHPGIIEYATKNCGPTWYWFMDPLTTAKATIAAEYAKCATYASATSSEVLELFKKVNPNSFQIIEGYDPDTYYYEQIPRKPKLLEITFIGNATEKRIKDIGNLLNVIDNSIEIFGENWPKEFCPNSPVYNDEERNVINQSKIVLNLCHSNIFSDRIIKSLGCGALVLSQYCDDINDEFKGIMEGKDNSLLQLYDSTSIAHYLIKLYLSDPGLKKETRSALSDHMRANYSWKSVCQKILNHTAKN